MAHVLFDGVTICPRSNPCQLFPPDCGPRGCRVDAEVAVIGAGVVGCATALALARRGVSVALLEAEPEPGLAASGTNSEILHTGFDSAPGELETRLILESSGLRDELLDRLKLSVLRCGAVMRAGGAAPEIMRRAQQNGVAG